MSDAVNAVFFRSFCGKAPLIYKFILSCTVAGQECSNLLVVDVCLYALVACSFSTGIIRTDNHSCGFKILHSTYYDSIWFRIPIILFTPFVEPVCLRRVHCRNAAWCSAKTLFPSEPQDYQSSTTASSRRPNVRHVLGSRGRARDCVRVRPRRDVPRLLPPVHGVRASTVSAMPRKARLLITRCF